MKPIDGDALFCKFWSLADPYVKQKKVFPSQVWNQAATMVREAPNLHIPGVILGVSGVVDFDLLISKDGADYSQNNIEIGTREKAVTDGEKVSIEA